MIEEFFLLSRMMDRNTYESIVCVFNYKGSSFGQRFLDLGGTIHSLGFQWEDNPFIIYKLYKYLKRTKPDIVQTYILKPNLYGRIAALLAGVPVIISTELTLKDQAHSVVSRLRDSILHPLNGFLNKYTDVVFCASEAVKRQWQNGSGSANLQVLHPFFDPSKLRSSEFQLNWKDAIENGNWVIGSVGRLSEEKRHVDLLNAFPDVLKAFPKARLLIVGDGDMRSELATLAKDLGISGSVTFTGFQTNVAEHLSKMHLFVLPSRSEALGIVLLEAMAMGLPVVASEVGGIPELVMHNHTGLLVQPLQPQQLAKAVVELLSDPERMRAMGRNGQARISSEFSAQQFIGQHESVYQSVLISKRAI